LNSPFPENVNLSKLQSCKVAKLQSCILVKFLMMTFTNGKYGVYASQIWCLQDVNIWFSFFNTKHPFC